MGCEDIIKVFFHMQHTIKLYHWQTIVFARHKATDDLLGSLSELIDKFIEVYIGRYQRPKFNKNLKINIDELSDDDDDNNSAVNMLKTYIKYMKYELPKYLDDDDTDLCNIRDELLGDLNKTLYLFTLS